MFAYATKSNWLHFGKNSPEYNKQLFAYFEGIDKNEMAILSDDLFTDLKPMKELGLKTIFITTGKYKISDITEDSKPDLVVNSLTELIERLS
jgi:4-nitrophenyl phosphatase